MVQDWPGAKEVVQDSLVAVNSAALGPEMATVPKVAGEVLLALLFIRVINEEVDWPTLRVPKLTGLGVSAIWPACAGAAETVQDTGLETNLNDCTLISVE